MQASRPGAASPWPKAPTLTPNTPPDLRGRLAARPQACAALLLVAGLMASGLGHAAPATLFGLDVLSAGDNITQAYGINAQGHAVGYSGSTQPDALTTQATFWAGGQSTAQGLQGLAGVGGSSVATAINNHNVLVGSQGGRALSWASVGPGPAFAAPQFLGSVNPGAHSAQAINDAGSVVGNYVKCLNIDCSSLHYRAWQWDTTDGMRQIGGEFGFETNVNGINGAGDVLVASRNLANERRFEIIAADGIAAAVSLPGLVSTTDLSINNQRAIAGDRLVAPSEGPARYEAFVWFEGIEHALAALDPAWGAEANAINNSGWVVGSSRLGPGEYAAVFWAGDLVWDLNSLLSDADADLWDLEAAVALSDNGWIAGNGWYTDPTTSARQRRGFTLQLSGDFLGGLPPSVGGGGGGGGTNPVPLPGTLALALLGLAAMTPRRPSGATPSTASP